MLGHVAEGFLRNSKQAQRRVGLDAFGVCPSCVSDLDPMHFLELRAVGAQGRAETRVLEERRMQIVREMPDLLGERRRAFLHRGERRDQVRVRLGGEPALDPAHHD